MNYDINPLKTENNLYRFSTEQGKALPVVH